jgi:hypothetical protein
MLRSLAALAIAGVAIASLQSCAVALATTAAMAADDAKQATLIRAVNGAEATRSQTQRWPGGEPFAIVAPTWSRGGLAIRLASMSELKGAGAPELHLAIVGRGNVKDVEARCHLGDLELNLIDRIEGRSWWRYAVGWDALGPLVHSGAELCVETVVGDWHFKLGPGYFKGFYDALAEGYKLAPAPGAPVKN